MPLMRSDREWTVDDLDELPDDGLQYELADGVLLVTPSPRPRHQRMSTRLTVVLFSACPDGLELFVAPFDFRPTRTTSLQPDLLVVRKEDVGEERLEGTPLLMVEILSPSTRAKDLVLKRALYAESGVPSYWVLDPMEGTAVVFRLEDGGYVEELRVTDGGVAAVTDPFAVTFAIADLIA
jgi:Uma2 family endonuclease